MAKQKKRDSKYKFDKPIPRGNEALLDIWSDDPIGTMLLTSSLENKEIKYRLHGNYIIVKQKDLKAAKEVIARQFIPVEDTEDASE